MPKLRLSKVISDKQIDRKSLSSEVNAAINRLLSQENNIEKINDEIAKDLRAISESLNISVFNLFIPVEKFYRLKIFEHLHSLNYSGTLKEQLEELFTKLSQTSNISFSLLAIYATQVLPEHLIKGSDLKKICKVLDTNLEDLKETSFGQNQTTSIENILISLDITLNDLSVLLKIPKQFIPWISVEPANTNQIGSTKPIENTESLSLDEASEVEFLQIPSACELTNGCFKGVFPPCRACARR